LADVGPLAEMMLIGKSGNSQQCRILFARIFLHQPGFIFSFLDPEKIPMSTKVARAARKIDIKDKGNTEMACEAVLKAMQQHPTESTVQRAASRALFNLVSGCGDNKLFFAKRQALSLLLKSVLEHDGASWPLVLVVW